MRRVALAVNAACFAAAVVVSWSGAPSVAVSRWAPAASSRFQLVLSGTPSAAQLRGPFTVMELDGFDTPTSVVTSLHARGKRAVCYVDVGTWESWRPDAESFPRRALGKPDQGWPGERWLDIRQQGVLLPIMAARFTRCVKKGFDAVDPDNVDGFENASGFALTSAEQLSYDRAIASLAHHDGLAVALKSDPDQARALEADFDFVVQEQCVQYAQCAELVPFVVHHKAVFDIEYTTSLAFCGSLPSGIEGLAKHLSLDGWVRWCPAPSG